MKRKAIRLCPFFVLPQKMARAAFTASQSCSNNRFSITKRSNRVRAFGPFTSLNRSRELSILLKTFQNASEIDMKATTIFQFHDNMKVVRRRIYKTHLTLDYVYYQNKINSILLLVTLL